MCTVTDVNFILHKLSKKKFFDENNLYDCERLIIESKNKKVFEENNLIQNKKIINKK